MFDANLCFSMSHRNIYDYQVDYHTHDCYEIVYYVDGTGVSKISETEYPYGSHTFCIIKPNTKHCEWTTSVVNLMYLGFNYDEQLGPLPNCLLKDDERHTVYKLMTRIQAELQGQKLHYDTMLPLLQMELVVTLLRLISNAPNVAKKSRDCMSYVTNFINSNFMNPIELEELSKSIGYSYHHFRHIFKEFYGISPKQYILNVRINHAKLLLQQGDLSVNEIARMCGFESASQFIATFKKNIGQTPLNYKHAAANFEERAQYYAKEEE